MHMSNIIQASLRIVLAFSLSRLHMSNMNPAPKEYSTVASSTIHCCWSSIHKKCRVYV